MRPYRLRINPYILFRASLWERVRRALRRGYARIFL